MVNVNLIFLYHLEIVEHEKSYKSPRVCLFFSVLAFNELSEKKDVYRRLLLCYVTLSLRRVRVVQSRPGQKVSVV